MGPKHPGSLLYIFFTPSAGVNIYVLLPQLGICIKFHDRKLNNIILTGICSTKEIQYDEQKIDFYPFHFLFPEGDTFFYNFIF